MPFGIAPAKQKQLGVVPHSVKNLGMVEAQGVRSSGKTKMDIKKAMEEPVKKVTALFEKGL